MKFDFSEEQQLFAEQVRRFAREQLANGALKRAHEPGFPFDVAQLMAKQGLMGITLPQEDGGQGGTLMDAVIAIEQIAAECPRSTRRPRARFSAHSRSTAWRRTMAI